MQKLYWLLLCNELLISTKQLHLTSTAMAANSGCVLQGLNQILIIGVHGAGELPALLAADSRMKFKLDLISLRL